MSTNYDPGQRFSRRREDHDPALNALMRELSDKGPQYELMQGNGPVFNMQLDAGAIGVLMTCVIDAIIMARRVASTGDVEDIRKYVSIPEDIDDQDIVQVFRDRSMRLPSLLEDVKRIAESVGE